MLNNIGKGRQVIKLFNVNTAVQVLCSSSCLNGTVKLKLNHTFLLRLICKYCDTVPTVYSV